MDEATFARRSARPVRAGAQSQTNRRLLLRLASGVLVVAAIVALAGCGGGGGDDEQVAPAQSTTVVPNTNVSLQLGDVSADSAGPPAQFTPEQSQAILKVVGDYLTAATVDPLRAAKPAGDLSALFDAGALARVTGPDRAVMLDEGLPKVTGDLNVTAQPVAVVGLADQGGGDRARHRHASTSTSRASPRPRATRSASCARATSCSAPTRPARGRSPRSTSPSPAAGAGLDRDHDHHA